MSESTNTVTNMSPQPMLNQFILDRFAYIPHNTLIENDYYAVYNTVLAKVFGVIDGPFVIRPPLPQALRVSTINSITYVVDVNELPIFFLEIKPPLYLDHIDTRIDLDAQMRAAFLALRDLTPIPRIHGVSAIGQKLAFYCMDKATGHISPDYVAPSTVPVRDTVPAERWETDITTEEGYGRFLAVINDVKQMAAALV